MSTKASYKRAWQLFHEFASLYNFAKAVPLSLEAVIMFISYLNMLGYKPKTIDSMMSGLGYVHKVYGYDKTQDTTNHFIVRKVLHSLRKTNPSEDLRLPITIEILQRIIPRLREIGLNAFLQSMYRAMFLLSFYAFLRLGEVTQSPHNLQYKDIHIRLSSILVQFHSHKHSTGKTTTIEVNRQNDNTLCPVQALEDFLKRRGTKPGPLFICRNTPITRADAVGILKKIIELENIPSKHFNGHSFRIGAATTFAAKGASDSQLREWGRWNSDAFKKYIRKPINI